ncbi:MAG: RNA polymerase-binding protein DksA [Holosporaceae bacterium]|jgi:DnaK suppressor protein|nr:RNA polymerase-binding protein DksA [Holosporaceae bacterium]
MSNKICELPEGYRPSSEEQFMNEYQKEYFRRKLLKWKDHIMREREESLRYIQEDGKECVEAGDRAASETGLTYELRSKERAHKLVSKIENALKKIQEGTYGYCEETGEPIAIERLEARPVALLSLEAQERHEKQERIKSDDEEK